MITIQEFYESYTLDHNFNENEYLEKHPETEDFYQPYCKENGISEKHRLFYHYTLYSKPKPYEDSDGFFQANKNIYIKPINGLGNRLHLLDSTYAFAKEFHYEKIYLCWAISEGFSDESFEELFDIQQLPSNVLLISEKEYLEKSKEFLSLENFFTQDREKLTYKTIIDKKELLSQVKQNSFCLNSYASIDWAFGIRLKYRHDFIKRYLHPSLKIKKKIDEYEINKSHIGLHIRKGDAIIGPWAKHYKESKDEYFENIIKAHLTSPIFLSTDSEESEKYYTSKYKNIIVSNKEFVPPSVTIKDYKPLQKEAVVDMFLLSKTRKIYGTNWSTFNEISSIVGDVNLEILSDETPINLDKKTDISVVTVTKNRCDILKSSIHSWLLHEEIKEIVIVDYSSNDFDKSYFENLDKRIKIIQVENKKYFNLSKAYNIAIDNASKNMILKLDVDYMLNPYNQLSDWLLIDSEKTFITGDWEENKKDNEIGFLEHLNGFCFIEKKHLIKINKYKGNQHGYGYDDCDLYNRLEKIGLQRIKLKFNKNFVPIFHVPHSDYYRSKHYENKNIKETLLKNMKEVKSWQ